MNKNLFLLLAKVCSAHFHPSCYTNKYKKTEFGNSSYTKVLKDNAIPTENVAFHTELSEFLPIQGESSTEPMKPIIIFNLNETEPLITYDSNAIIEAAGSSSTIKVIENIPIELNAVKEPLPTVENNIEKYENTNTLQDYFELEKENGLIQCNITQLEERIALLKSVCENKQEKLKEKSYDVARAKKQYNLMVHNSFTMEKKKKILSKALSETQMDVLMGKKKFFWNDLEMAAGVTVQTLSSKTFYEYLTKTLNYPLPALSSLKRWMKGRKLENPEAKDDDKK